MKKFLLPLLTAFFFVWASSITFLYLRLKSNPRVVAVTMDPSLQQSHVGEMEKLTFLRQFLDRYFNYDSNHFWQSQTSLASLMAPRLADKRVTEVRRLREKIQGKNLSQVGMIRELQLLPDGSYLVDLHLQITEEKDRKNLYSHLAIRISNIESTLENPWGLLVERLDFTKSQPRGDDFTKTILIKKGTPTLITFPCAIENLKNPIENQLQTKITTLNVSEIQMMASTDLSGPVEFTASCRDLAFAFTLSPGAEQISLFKAFPLNSATVRKKEIFTKPREKDMYEQTIKKAMGIQL